MSHRGQFAGDVWRYPPTPSRWLRNLWRSVAGLVLVGGATVALLLVMHARRDHVLRAAIERADPDCPAVSDGTWWGPGGRYHWPNATGSSIIDCGGPLAVGGFVAEIRFSDAAALGRDVVARPPDLPICIAGKRVEVGALDTAAQFRELCAGLDGHLIDAVSGLSPLLDQNGHPVYGDRGYRLTVQRDSRLQGVALRRLYGVPAP